MFYALVLCVLFISYGVSAQRGIEKQNVKVLYVGFNPKLERPTMSKFFNANSDRARLDVISRWPAFMLYLNTRFTNVQAVDAREFKEEMSLDYDVTIIDELTTSIKEAVIEKDAEGNVLKYLPAAYLSDNYKSATIFVGKVATDMGQSIGSKLDWSCLCLSGDTYNVKTEHPIFNTPEKVDLTFTTKKTPSNFYHYPNSSTIPKEIPSWRVQGLDFKNSDYQIGMVSRGAGFLDSPDTEYISGGDNTKSMDAVAIGRHGNLFLWGFSASPDYMTDEAQKVFSNAIVYMKNFNGVSLVAKKMNDRIKIRDSYLFFKNRDVTQENFNEFKSKWLKYKKKDFDRKKELEAKIANGEKLNKFQQSFLDKMEPIPTLDSWLPKQIGEDMYKKFGADINGYLSYLNTNKEYLIATDNDIIVDEDVKKLGVSNRKIELLENAVSLLDKGGKKAKLGKRVLDRYTEQSFTTTAEYKTWLTTNKDRLFFTESGGYKWLVNTVK